MINQDSISFTQIRDDLITYIKSLPEEKRWVDMLASGTGMTIIELIAGFGAFLSFKILMSQREMHISTAQQRSAVLGMAETLGYSASRGEPAQIMLNVTTADNTTFSRFQTIGIYDNLFDIVCMEDKVITGFTPSSLQVCIGDRKIESLILNTDKPAILRFDSVPISDYFRVFLNTVEMTISSDYRDLLTQLFVVFTNPQGGLDVFSLNNQIVKYTAADILTLEYIVYANILTVEASKLVLDNHTSEIISSSAASAAEDLDHIKVSAPVKHETLGLIKGRADYLKLAKTFMPTALDVSARDLSPAVIELSFIPAMLGLPSDIEKAILITKLSASRPFGVQPPTVTDPKIIPRTINVTVRLSIQGTSPITISDDILAILRTYEYRFALELSTDQIESDIEDLVYVRTARVSFPVTMTDTFTVDPTNDLLIVASSWVNGLPIRLSSTAALPAPLQPDITYYVIHASQALGTDIALSAQPDGPIIDIIDSGSGSHTITSYDLTQLAWNEYANFTLNTTVV